MKAVMIVLILLAVCSSAIGQSQIDSLVALKQEIDKTKQYIIYDYRLPEWGYHRFYLDFSGWFSGTDNTAKEHTTNINQHNIQFNPYFYSYTESEEKITLVQSSLISSYRYDKYESLDDNSEESKSTGINLNFSFSGDIRKYLDREWFLKFDTKSIFRYEETNNKTSGIYYKTNDTSILRQYQPSVRIGAGYGRIRNVSPVFRALRFNERLKNISGANGLNVDDLNELSAFFTRRDSYSQIYNRPNKYFYSELPKNIVNRLVNMTPWEMMYLNDVWSEITGDRFEGFEVNGGLSINYEKNIYSPGLNDTELFLWGFYLGQRYYHNITPYYQIGTSFYSSFSRVLNENTSYDYFGNGNLHLLNLWNLTDKMLIEWDLGLETGFTSFESDQPANNSNWQRMDNYYTDLSFRYFIENNLSINTDILYSFYHNWPESIAFHYDDIYYYNWQYAKEKHWSIQIDLRYYLTRGLY